MELAELLVILLVAVVTFGGLALGFVPGLPQQLTLAPDLVFYLFLPPLVTSAGWPLSIRDLRANIRPIVLLAVGLVLVTLVVIAAVAHLAIGFAWAAAFVPEAIVSPTDDVAGIGIGAKAADPEPRHDDHQR
jgi:CPA1 family monovalent cation:H+ antiporter